MKAKRRVLFVDDSPYRWDYFCQLFKTRNTSGVEFAWAKNYDQAVEQLESGDWDVVFLDHDLEDPGDWDPQAGWRDGTAVVDWIREHTPHIGFVVCHSMNPVGRNRMVTGLERSGYSARQVPYYTFDGIVPQLIDLILNSNPVSDTDVDSISMD